VLEGGCCNDEIQCTVPDRPSLPAQLKPKPGIPFCHGPADGKDGNPSQKGGKSTCGGPGIAAAVDALVDFGECDDADGNAMRKQLRERVTGVGLAGKVVDNKVGIEQVPHREVVRRLEPRSVANCCFNASGSIKPLQLPAVARTAA
jgi:hypothetical protein